MVIGETIIVIPYKCEADYLEGCAVVYDQLIIMSDDRTIVGGLTWRLTFNRQLKEAVGCCHKLRIT